ncbi:MAG: hypothetical protein NT027_02510 [Proteobacteria bacterium]|nr:hypothetical protein [Pseudomonadota bacterium]
MKIGLVPNWWVMYWESQICNRPISWRRESEINRTAEEFCEFEFHPYIFHLFQSKLSSNQYQTNGSNFVLRLTLQEILQALNCKDESKAFEVVESFAKMKLQTVSNKNTATEALFLKWSSQLDDQVGATFLFHFSLDSFFKLFGLMDAFEYLAHRHKTPGQSWFDFDENLGATQVDLNLWGHLDLSQKNNLLMISREMAIRNGKFLDDSVFAISLPSLSMKIMKRDLSYCSNIFEILQQIHMLGATPHMKACGFFCKALDNSKIYKNIEGIDTNDPRIIWVCRQFPEYLKAEVNLVGNAYYKFALHLHQFGVIAGHFENFRQKLGISENAIKIAISNIGSEVGGVLKIAGKFTLHLHTLFLHLSLDRSFFLLNGRFPLGLPEAVIRNCSLNGDVRVNFSRFVKELESLPNLISIIESHLLNGMQNSVVESLFQGDSLKHADSEMASNSSRDGKSKCATDAPPVLVDRFQPLSANIKSSGLGRNEGAFDSEEGLRSKMIRIAANELDKMISGDRRNYLKLKESYFKSLESHQLQLVQDIQSRLKPAIFDQQIRPRLVKYMIANPGQWTSNFSVLQ